MIKSCEGKFECLVRVSEVSFSFYSKFCSENVSESVVNSAVCYVHHSIKHTHTRAGSLWESWSLTSVRESEVTQDNTQMNLHTHTEHRMHVCMLRCIWTQTQTDRRERWSTLCSGLSVYSNTADLTWPCVCVCVCVCVSGDTSVPCSKAPLWTETHEFI